MPGVQALCKIFLTMPAKAVNKIMNARQCKNGAQENTMLKPAIRIGVSTPRAAVSVCWDFLKA